MRQDGKTGQSEFAQHQGWFGVIELSQGNLWGLIVEGLQGASLRFSSLSLLSLWASR